MWVVFLVIIWDIGRDIQIWLWWRFWPSSTMPAVWRVSMEAKDWAIMTMGAKVWS